MEAGVAGQEGRQERRLGGGQCEPAVLPSHRQGTGAPSPVELLWATALAPISYRIFDLCPYGMGNGMLCTSLEAYAKLCTLHSVHLPEWRASLRGSKCPFTF